MLKGVEDGKSQKAFRREIQRRDLSADCVRHGHSRGLSGSSIAQSNSGAMGGEVCRGQLAQSAVGSGKSFGEASREASSEGWRDDDGDRPFKKIQRTGSAAEKRKWVRDHGQEFGSVSKACEVVGISSSSYYYKPKVHPSERAKKDADLRGLIEEIQAQFPQYGVRQVYWELLWGYGKRVNRKRIHRVMREHGLRAQIYRGFKISTTDSDHSNRIYPNLLHGREVTKLNEVWVTDITYVRIQTCFVYLSAIIDLLSRKVVGWAVSKKINTDLCLEALKMAIEIREPSRGCIHHSDRGVQYTSDEYTDLLKEKGFEISMSRKGNCWDNAHMESFFGTLKQEEVYLKEYETFTDVIFSLPNFIEGIYNEKRRKGALGGLTPNDFEDKWRSGELQKLGIPAVIKLWDGSSN